MFRFIAAFLVLATPAFAASDIDGTWSALSGHTALTLDMEAGQYRLIENTSIKDGAVTLERKDGPVYTLSLDGDVWTLIVQSYEPGKYLNGTMARQGAPLPMNVRFTP
jgi:hypothetical protein